MDCLQQVPIMRTQVNEQPLLGRKILIVEDEFLIAMDIETSIEDAGGEVVGPAGTVDAALAAVTNAGDIDGAVLDINLRGKLVYPVADALAERQIPFIFTTGYDDGSIPERFAAVRRCGKPIALPELLEHLHLRGSN
jgi:CheY-like chemotaxis protein